MTANDPTLPADAGRTDLRQDHAAVPPGSRPVAGLPARVGRFRPLRVIGQGGMGVVYEAEQEEPQRRVALKVIRPELSTEGLRRRFAHESQFLARLQHPGIAQVYEAGTAETPDGPLPYIAMELVDGLPLNVWVRQHNPDRRTRLELMIQLCSAVHHAHQRGLIHRDLKPGNVLVDGQGRPRVLDFGVARPADENLQTTLVTTHGEIVGTLSYMSPEQLGGDPNDLDTRSDVYALGVILYELLSGRQPLDLKGRPLEEALRAVRQEDPPPLASHDSKLEGDLTVIAAMAMAKDRDQRYASANGLALDLQRHLDDQPIAARPPGTIYLLRKFARRHRPLVFGIAGMLAVLVLGVVASTWQAVRATRAENLAASRLQQAEAVTDFLQNMLAAIQPEEAKGRDVTVREVLDRAAVDLDNGSLADRPRVESALRHTLGNTYRSLGQFDRSEHELQLGLARSDSLEGRDAPERLQIILDLARTLSSRGGTQQAGRLAANALALAQPRSVEAAGALAVLADVRYSEGRWQAADSLQQIVQAITADLNEPDSPKFAEVLLGRAFLAEQRTDYTLADSLTGRAAVIFRQAYGDQDPRMMQVLNKQGDIAKSLGRYPDAKAYYLASLAIADSVYSPEHPLRADVLWRLGDTYRVAGDLDSAETAFTSALEIRRKALGPVHRDIALVLSSLGNLAVQRQRFTEAEEWYGEALAMREEIFGRVHASVVSSLEDLGNLERARKRPAQAESLYVQAQNRLDQLPEATGSLASFNAFHIAMALQDQGQHAEAEKYFRHSLGLETSLNPPPSANVARAMANLATCLFRQGRKREAGDLMVQTLAMNRALDVQGDSYLLSLGNAAYILDDAGRYAEADSLHREYIDLAGELYAVQNPQQSNARARYFDNLVARTLWPEAAEQARAIVAWRQQYLDEDDYRRASGSVLLAEALLGLGRTAEADSLLSAAEARLKKLSDVPVKVTARAQQVRAELNAVIARR